MSSYPTRKLRRLRENESVRQLCGMPPPPLSKMIWPVFVVDGEKCRIPIESMPGQCRMSIDILLAELEKPVKDGLGGMLIFGHVEESYKDAHASYAYREDALVQRAVREIRHHFPVLPVFTDVCLCGYTDHGHCGPVDEEGRVDNEKANEILAEISVSHAAAGAHGVAPSAMMDGQVSAIRGKLAENELDDTIVMSYSTKFASAMYGPFRDAAGSAPSYGDRRTYQASYSAPDQAVMESQLDEKEGADILMVKPALCYLDIISEIKNELKLPLAAYNVSGEYSMLHATAERGWGDLHGMARESLTAIYRAGADIIITYWANQYNEL